MGWKWKCCYGCRVGVKEAAPPSPSSLPPSYGLGKACWLGPSVHFSYEVEEGGRGCGTREKVPGTLTSGELCWRGVSLWLSFM